MVKKIVCILCFLLFITTVSADTNVYYVTRDTTYELSPLVDGTVHIGYEVDEFSPTKPKKVKKRVSKKDDEAIEISVHEISKGVKQSLAVCIAFIIVIGACFFLCVLVIIPSFATWREIHKKR
jgi:hypothetical protein